jgi:hypothetical protein
MLYLALRFVHIALMATWFGSVLFLAGDVRRTVTAGPDGFPLLAGRVKRSNVVAIAAGWGTILTGVALIFTVGGFGAVPPTIHVALLLSLVNAGVGAAMGATWGKIAANPANANDHLGRLSMLSGVFQLLWTINLALMVFRHTAT